MLPRLWGQFAQLFGNKATVVVTLAQPVQGLEPVEKYHHALQNMLNAPNIYPDQRQSNEIRCKSPTHSLLRKSAADISSRQPLQCARLSQISQSATARTTRNAALLVSSIVLGESGHHGFDQAGTRWCSWSRDRANC